MDYVLGGVGLVLTHFYAYSKGYNGGYADVMRAVTAQVQKINKEQK